MVDVYKRQDDIKKHTDECVKVIEEAIFDTVIQENDMVWISYYIKEILTGGFKMARKEVGFVVTDDYKTWIEMCIRDSFFT